SPCPAQHVDLAFVSFCYGFALEIDLQKRVDSHLCLLCRDVMPSGAPWRGHRTKDAGFALRRISMGRMPAAEPLIGTGDRLRRRPAQAAKRPSRSAASIRAAAKRSAPRADSADVKRTSTCSS